MFLSAIEEGAEGVLLLTCPRDLCHFRDGTRWAGRVAEKTAHLLKLIGFSGERIRLVETGDGRDVRAEIRTFAASLGIEVGSLDALEGAPAEKVYESVKR